MTLTDIMPVEKWAEFENEVHNKTGLDANAFDKKGTRISSVKNWANKICPAIKDTDKGQSFICAVAHMNLAAIAEKTGEPVIEECDAGIIKMVVPVFYKNEFAGAFGACGLLQEDGEIDDFMINKTTGISQEKIEEFSKDIGIISREDAKSAALDIKKKIEEVCVN